ncbi:MAG: redoxin family protein [Nitrospinota bacterium]
MKPKFFKSGIVTLLVFVFLFPLTAHSGSSKNRAKVLMIGKPLPSVKLKAFGNLDIDLSDLKGKIKIISVVPKLNTPVCDIQTHKFSETNGGLDKHVDIITLSTNTMESQQEFAKKTKIKNLLFLSDMPELQFGKNTGLLIEGLGVLRRTVIVADQNNIIRYVDFVPGGGLPNINKALEEARILLKESQVKG